MLMLCWPNIAPSHRLLTRNRAATAADRLVTKGWNAPVPFSVALRNTGMAIHSHAAGSSRQNRRTRNTRATDRNAWSDAQPCRLGNRLRAITKPEMAKNRSTPHAPCQ